ncbi:MAG: nuclear transport factor 2 family protein [Burkholderiales bacterium]|nr:nuclear transport factor 2 family protein [Burkholderiales bacterium]
MNYRPFAAALLSVTALTSNAQPASTSADEAAIREARRVQTQALAKNDLDTVVKYWDPAITIRRALGHPVEGAAAARKLLEPAGPVTASTIVYQRESAVVNVSSNWPLAYEEGRWSGHVGRADSKPILSGKYAAQWVKRDGQWIIRSEVFVALDCADAGCKAAALP